MKATPHDDARDILLDELLSCEPPPFVVALDASGAFVPMPPSVPVKDRYVIEGRTSTLRLVISADLPAVIETWERALRDGAASATVHLRGNPADPVSLHFVDARHRYGVLLRFIVGPSELSNVSVGADTAIRPRVWFASKNEFAVFIDVDAAVTGILGWTPQEMIGRRSLEFIHPEDRPRAIANWMDVRAAPAASRRARLRHQHRDGSWIWFEFTNTNLLNDPMQRCVRSEMVNISDEMAALEALRASEGLLRQLAEALPLGVVQIDASGRVVYRNGRLLSIVGNPLAATIDEQLSGVVAPDREALTAAIQATLHDGTGGDLEVTLSQSGAHRRCSVSLHTLTDGKDAPAGGIICISDVTDRTRLREELEVRANYDALTGCRNRASILAALDSAMQTPSAPDAGTAVLFVDLDGFKEVNDSFGHAIGDELLRRTSARLIAVARGGDIVGRLGGDEFLIVCQNTTQEQAAAIGERIAATLGQPVCVGAVRIEPSASIGVAWTRSSTDSDALVAAADAAMYDAKRESRGHPIAPLPPDASSDARRAAALAISRSFVGHHDGPAI
jgi:diguanylate cyclase (GGDEF)-like protein/PAS domain S-box-containing protein